MPVVNNNNELFVSNMIHSLLRKPLLQNSIKYEALVYNQLSRNNNVHQNTNIKATDNSIYTPLAKFVTVKFSHKLQHFLPQLNTLKTVIKRFGISQKAFVLSINVPIDYRIEFYPQ